MPDALSLEQAKSQWLDLIERLESEEVALLEATGRVLAADAVSDIDLAPFDHSAMDGYAARAADLASASAEAPRSLEVIAHIAAGDWCQVEVRPGTAARIMTGAPVPPGADTVVKVEDTTVVSGSGSVGSIVRFTHAALPGAHIRLKGGDARQGEVVLHAGVCLDPAAIGLLASTGHARVAVYRRPRVGVLSTGSELVPVEEVPGSGKIRNSNNYLISAQVIRAGGIPVAFPIVSDSFEATKAALEQAAATCDLVVTSGGTSVGDFDYIKPALEAVGTRLRCDAEKRPGSPQVMGRIGAAPFFGLPGNPASASAGFETFVRPAIHKMWGKDTTREIA